jgi:hypothetical protein
MSKKNSISRCQIQKCGKRCTYIISLWRGWYGHGLGFCPEHGEKYLKEKKNSEWPKYKVSFLKAIEQFKFFDIERQ